MEKPPLEKAPGTNNGQISFPASERAIAMERGISMGNSFQGATRLSSKRPYQRELPSFLEGSSFPQSWPQLAALEGLLLLGGWVTNCDRHYFFWISDFVEFGWEGVIYVGL